MSPLRFRLVLALAMCLLFTAVTVVLIWKEADLEPAPPRAEAVFHTPPTVGMDFTREAREANLMLVGATPEVVRNARETFQRLDRRQEAIVAALGEARRQTVADTFCPRDLPVFYRGALLLVRGAPGATEVVPPDAEAFGQPWDVFDDREIVTLFETWEGANRERRAEDATLALSALVLGRTEDAIGDRRAPWDQTAAGGGRLRDVVAAFGDAERLLGDYLATAHVLAEIVSAAPEAHGCTESAGGTP